MDVRIIEGDHYRVVTEWRRGRDSGYTLDDSVFSLVDRCWDTKCAEFFLFCFRHRSEACDCCEAVKAYRKSCFLDTDNQG